MWDSLYSVLPQVTYGVSFNLHMLLLSYIQFVGSATRNKYVYQETKTPLVMYSLQVSLVRELNRLRLWFSVFCVAGFRIFECLLLTGKDRLFTLTGVKTWAEF